MNRRVYDSTFQFKSVVSFYIRVEPSKRALLEFANEQFASIVYQWFCYFSQLPTSIFELTYSVGFIRCAKLPFRAKCAPNGKCTDNTA